MLIRERSAVSEEKKESTTIHWIVGFGTVFFLALVLRDCAQKNLALDLPQAVLETIALASALGLPYLAFIGVSGLIAGHQGWGAREGIICAALALLPLFLLMVYAHFAMSEALAPLKRQFAQRVAEAEDDARRPEGSARRSPSYTDLLAARDELLRTYGYRLIGSWQATEDGADCHAVYLFTAGLLVDEPSAEGSDQGSDEARDAF